MSLSVAIADPLGPHQQVIVFKPNAVSGATLGYHGTITRVLRSSVVRFPTEPYKWVYRVFVPFFNRDLDVEAWDLFATGRIATFERSAEPVCAVQFDAPPDDDNFEIHGGYKLPARDWDYFAFHKCDQLHASYQLQMACEYGRARTCQLEYHVPANAVLDRNYVLRAIGEIIGSNNERWV